MNRVSSIALPLFLTRVFFCLSISTWVDEGEGDRAIPFRSSVQQQQQQVLCERQPAAMARFPLGSLPGSETHADTSRLRYKITRDVFPGFGHTV